MSYLKSSFRTGLLEQPLVYLYIISSYGRGHEGGCDRNYSFHNDLSLYDRSDCSSISYPNLQPFLEIKKMSVQEIISKLYNLPSRVAIRYLELHLTFLKKRKSRLEGKIRLIEDEIEELHWNLVCINNFIINKRSKN